MARAPVALRRFSPLFSAIFVRSVELLLAFLADDLFAAYFMPLPLYGSGGRKRISAAN